MNGGMPVSDAAPSFAFHAKLSSLKSEHQVKTCMGCLQVHQAEFGALWS